MYDEFSSDYDRFVNWDSRLATELPFIEGHLQSVAARRVLDVACGTGMHAIALAKRGYDVVGVDLSAKMIEHARANAAAEGVEVRFLTGGFVHLHGSVRAGFDALLCLGNSLPHVLTPGDLAAALSDFGACLRTGGLLLIQNRNFDAVLAQRQRWMEPQGHRQGPDEWVFLRFYDFVTDSRLVFNVLTLRRRAAGKWSQAVASTELWPLRRRELTVALSEAGFGAIRCFGDMTGKAFQLDASPNLVLTASCLARRVER
jgi:glycine/sarcosine N-methyltransferase